MSQLPAARRNDLATVDAIEAFAVTVSATTRWILVRVTLSSGVVGFGEATDFGYHDRVVGEIATLDRELGGRRHQPGVVAEVVTGPDAAQLCPATRSGVEQALLDAMARAAGVNVATFLGGGRNETVHVYANINRGVADRSPAGWARHLIELSARGVLDEYGAVKIAPFDEFDATGRVGEPGVVRLEEGLERIWTVRDQLGSDTALRVDCHYRLDPKTLTLALSELDGCDLDWIEDPLDPTLFDDQSLRDAHDEINASGRRVAGGEDVVSDAEIDALLSIGHLDVFLPDLRLTGVRGGLAALESCASHRIAASLHSPVGPVLDALGIQVGAIVDGFEALERQVGETPLYHKLADPQPVHDGRVVVPNSPGLGLRVDLDTVINRNGTMP